MINKKFSINYLSGFLFQSFIVLVFAYPRQFQVPKALIICISMLLVLLKNGLCKKNNLFINSHFILWSLIFTIYSLVWSTIGLINNSPGVIDYFRIFFIWNIILSIYIIIQGHNLKDKIVDAIFFANALTSIISLIRIGSIILSRPINAWFIPIFNVGLNNGYIQIDSPNLGLMMFSIPFCIAFLISNYSRLSGIRKLLLTISVMITLSYIMLSGRRALWLVVAATPIISFMHKIFYEKRKIEIRSIVIPFFVFILIGYITIKISGMNIDGLLGRIESLLSKLSSGNEIRQIQSRELLSESLRKPWFGTGFGKGISTHIRDVEKPWRYELTFHLLLLNSGVFGIIIHTIWLFIPVAFSYLSKRKWKILYYSTAVITGLLCYFFASFTNPYIISGFDYRFPLYLSMYLVVIS